jgi:hypothetical protein
MALKFPVVDPQPQRPESCNAVAIMNASDSFDSIRDLLQDVVDKVNSLNELTVMHRSGSKNVKLRKLLEGDENFKHSVLGMNCNNHIHCFDDKITVMAFCSYDFSL